MRVATYNVELEREGPGLLLRDILKGEDPQVSAVARVIAKIRPDVLVLQGVDYDYDLLALRALRDVIALHGIEYTHIFARRPNSGMATGLDMDGDGYVGDAKDAQSYGKFSGQDGMAVLSRYPLDTTAVQDFSAILWQDFPDALVPVKDDGAVFPSEEAMQIQRLSSVGHWVLPVSIDGATLELLMFHASAPVFDGPEDRNGKRNHDEIHFWQHFLGGEFGPAPQASFVLLGDANSDPNKGESLNSAIKGLLSDSRLQDPLPKRSGAQTENEHDDSLNTVNWPPPGPGEMRVDYVLPSADLRIAGSGVFWPDEGQPMADDVRLASRHRIVWVDLEIKPN